MYDADAPAADPTVLEMDVPVLGICYGLQFMAHHLGGTVEPAPRREYGHAEVELVAESRLFRGLPGTIDVWMSHGDEARELPEGFAASAATENALAGIANEERRMWAVQFHPEVAHTRQRDGAAEELCRGHLRGGGELDAGALHPDDGRSGARAGWGGACDLRFERGRGFQCGGGAGERARSGIG